MSFKREFDYYSLGLMLLEIGVWESLSSVYKRQLTSSPSQLRKEYIRHCEKQLLERMGPIYSKVTMKCLESESHFSGKEADVAVAFQNLVIDELKSCKVRASHKNSKLKQWLGNYYLFEIQVRLYRSQIDLPPL